MLFRVSLSPSLSLRHRELAQLQKHPMAAMIAAKLSSLSATAPLSERRCLAPSQKALSSSASISSAFPQPKLSKSTKKHNCAVSTRAMAKELHFNKDGATMKKLQVLF